MSLIGEESSPPRSAGEPKVFLCASAQVSLHFVFSNTWTRISSLFWCPGLAAAPPWPVWIKPGEDREKRRSAAAEVQAVAPLFRFFCRLTEDLLRRRSPPKNKDRYVSRTQRNTQNVCLSHRLESSVRLSGSEVQPPFILKAPLTFRTRLHAGKTEISMHCGFSVTHKRSSKSQKTKISKISENREYLKIMYIRFCRYPSTHLSIRQRVALDAGRFRLKPSPYNFSLQIFSCWTDLKISELVGPPR